MKSILLICTLLISFSSVQAGQCYSAFKEAKKLEKMVKGVYWTSETDDYWTGFASWEPIKNVSLKEIKRVLNLKDTFEGETAHISMESHKEVYDLIRYEIEGYLDEDVYDEPASATKMKRLIKYISKNYGKRARLVLYGAGDGDSFFVGDHMIVLIMKNGCVLGLKAETVWT